MRFSASRRASQPRSSRSSPPGRLVSGGDRREQMQLVLAGLDHPVRRLGAYYAPGSASPSGSETTSRASSHLSQGSFQVPGRSVDVSAEEEGSGLPLARVAERPRCTHRRTSPDRPLERMLDAMLAADLLDQADRARDGGGRVLLQPRTSVRGGTSPRSRSYLRCPGSAPGLTASVRSRFTAWYSRIMPLCIQSQRPCWNGWQFVCWTGDPVEARMCAKTRPDVRCAERARRFQSFHAGSMLRKTCPSLGLRTSRSESVSVRLLRSHLRVQALDDQGSSARRAAPRRGPESRSMRASGTC